jgi:hypothetical protein
MASVPACRLSPLKLSPDPRRWRHAGSTSGAPGPLPHPPRWAGSGEGEKRTAGRSLDPDAPIATRGPSRERRGASGAPSERTRGRSRRGTRLTLSGEAGKHYASYFLSVPMALQAMTCGYGSSGRESKGSGRNGSIGGRDPQLTYPGIGLTGSYSGSDSRRPGLFTLSMQRHRVTPRNRMC